MKLSVIMPAYNEAAGIAAAVAELVEHALPLASPGELIVVDDGSRDATGEILDRLAVAEPALHPLHKPNGGHGSALLAGLAAARGEWLLLLDADRQIPLSELARLWAAAQAGDAAFGVRRRRDNPWLRRRLTALVRGVLPPLFGARLHDANVPYKLVRKSLWEAARPFIPADTLAPSLFLAIFAVRSGYRVAQLDVPHRERQTGTVSLRKWRLLRFCARAFAQLLAFRRRLPAKGQRQTA